MKQFFLFVVICLFTASCDLMQKEYEFYYYPAMNVYYDVANKMYLYSLDGGKHWDSAYVLNQAEPATLGSRQVIKSQTPEIWLENDVHVQRYRGNLINIIADTVANSEPSVKERKITVSKTATQSDKEPEKKPGFFKRLFGKKNKN